MEKYNIDFLIGQKILFIRKEHGLTGVQIAKYLGVSQQKISRYERGRTPIKVSFLLQISLLFDIDIGFFLTDFSKIMKEKTTHSLRHDSIIFIKNKL